MPVRVLLLSMVLGSLAQPAVAQSKAAAPQPGPEHKRLQFFVGEWRVEDTEKTSPLGPGGKTTGTVTCEWFDGKFQVLCRSSLNRFDGLYKELEILSYNASDGEYTRYFIGSHGHSALSKAKFTGKTWEWSGTFKADGKSMRMDAHLTDASTDSITTKSVLTVDEGAPMTVSEGKMTRVK